MASSDVASCAAGSNVPTSDVSLPLASESTPTKENQLNKRKHSAEDTDPMSAQKVAKALTATETVASKPEQGSCASGMTGVVATPTEASLTPAFDPKPKSKVPEAIAKSARKKGFLPVLEKLLLQPEIVKANVSASDVLEALKRSKGLLHPAKRDILENRTH